MLLSVRHNHGCNWFIVPLQPFSLILVGFLQFCKDLNQLVESESEFSELGRAACSAVLNNLPLPSGKTAAETNSINGIAYLCRSCAQASPHPEDKEIEIALNSSTILSRGAIEAFVRVYNEVKESASLQASNIRVRRKEILVLAFLFLHKLILFHFCCSRWVNSPNFHGRSALPCSQVIVMS